MKVGICIMLHSFKSVKYHIQEVIVMQALVLPTSLSKFPLLFHFLDHTLWLVTSLILLHSYLYILALFVSQLFLGKTYLSKNV